ncbi:uncharacterized protein J4E78_006236 [Alternaria triticimaculans]|uniref:uncharacterized protein n=2 Tax=Alternaria sect. Infectoriae TaxID=2499258 RepID=UPI0020C40088|nr:uncharacterized protein J4E78_006236 [Alternaria triticimaculans]KAI4657847.1 hypothetical protein J4E78_006236 [Alternaria triticimaculans]
MYASILNTLLITGTTLAASLPPSPGHPFIPSEYVPESAHPAAKRQGLPLGDVLGGGGPLGGLGDLLGAGGDAESSSAAPAPALTPVPRASDIVMTTTMVTVTATLSTPLPEAPSASVSPVPEDLAGVYVCDDINWNGACSHHFTKPGGSDIDCAQLSGRESSIGPDPGFLCEFFTNNSCHKTPGVESDFLSLSWPGNADLRSTDKGDLNDKFLSYVCFKVL